MLTTTRPGRRNSVGSCQLEIHEITDRQRSADADPGLRVTLGHNLNARSLARGTRDCAAA